MTAIDHEDTPVYLRLRALIAAGVSADTARVAGIDIAARRTARQPVRDIGKRDQQRLQRRLALAIFGIGWLVVGRSITAGAVAAVAVVRERFILVAFCLSVG